MKCVCPVVQGDDAASFFLSHQDGTDVTDTVTEEGIDNAFTKDVACSVIFQCLDEVLSAGMMAHQGDVWRVWEFLQRKNSANPTFKKAALRSCLAQTRYNVQSIAGLHCKSWNR